MKHCSSFHAYNLGRVVFLFLILNRLGVLTEHIIDLLLNKKRKTNIKGRRRSGHPLVITRKQDFRLF